MDDASRAEYVRDEIAAGVSPQDVAFSLIQMGSGPIAACKALRSGGGIRLIEAKFLVDAALPADVQAANERLRDAAEAALYHDDES